MRKGFIIFAIIAVVAALAFAFLTQDDLRQDLLGTPDKPDEVSQVEQDAIKIATSYLREKQVREYELLVEAFMELYPLTNTEDVWYIVVTVLELDYACRAQIEALDKGE